MCDFGTFQDGRTYVHCHLCERCVKPTWSHCSRCNRCALADHPCDKFRQKSAVQQSREVVERYGSERKRKADELVAKSTSHWKVTWNNKIWYCGIGNKQDLFSTLIADKEQGNISAIFVCWHDFRSWNTLTLNKVIPGYFYSVRTSVIFIYYICI